MKPKVPFLGAAAAALATAFLASTPLVTPAAAATPPPTPPPITAPATQQPEVPVPLTGASATPIPIPSGFGLPGSAPSKPGATPTPPVPQRAGITGVWEVAIQRGDKTEYTHFNVAQKADVLTGTYRDSTGKVFPLNGTVDGQQVRMIVSLPNGTTLLLEGKLDGTSDMIGMFTSSREQVYFTAAWRPKERWIENVNASPGGMGGMGGGPPR